MCDLIPSRERRGLPRAAALWIARLVGDGYWNRRPGPPFSLTIRFKCESRWKKLFNLLGANVCSPQRKIPSPLWGWWGHRWMAGIHHEFPIKARHRPVPSELHNSFVWSSPMCRALIACWAGRPCCQLVIAINWKIAVRSFPINLSSIEKTDL